MGTAERKEREKIRRRNDIIGAAERVFFSKSRALATMDDVAEEAELSKGNEPSPFSSKQFRTVLRMESLDPISIHLRPLLGCGDIRPG